MSPGVRFQLLGPVEVWAGRERVEIGTPRHRAVLAALLVDAGRVVPAEVLIERVWGREPPAQARRTVQSYLVRTRVLLARVGSGQLVRRGGGYALEVDPDLVDLHRFTALVEGARAGDPAGRASTLDRALALWQGTPLGGVDGDWADNTREALRRQFLGAVLDWAPAALAAGDPAPVIDRLAALQGQYPLVESLTAWLVRALTAAGRTAEALGQYAGATRRLLDDLGADPGPELRAAHQEALRGTLTPGTAPAPPPAAPARPAGGGPATLPAVVHGFVGRTGELAWLDGLLAAAADDPTAAVVAALSGTAGVGKTSLAVHWAHRVAGRFPDGQLYVNLRGFDPGGEPLDPAVVLRQFLDALGARHAPPDRDALAAAYRSRLAGRRILVVLDNAADETQVRPLLPGAPGCVAVVTSRNQLPGLVAVDGARPIPLAPLGAREARDLLARRLGEDRVAVEPDAAAGIVERCARLPLALAIVAARAAFQPNLRLADLAAELREAAGRLRVLGSGEDPYTDLRAVFACSDRALGPEAAGMFRLLGLHPGPDIGLASAASLAALPVPQARRRLAQLVNASLLSEVGGRYVMHDLVRAYAAELASSAGQCREALGGEAVGRLLDHYAHSACAAAHALRSVRDAVLDGPPRPGVAPERPADAEHALAWFGAEHRALLAAIGLAGANGFDTHVWQLAWALDDYLDGAGSWEDWAATGAAAVAAGERLGDPAVRSRAHRLLSRAYAALGRLEEAAAQLRHSLALAHEGDLLGRARNHMALAYILVRQDDHVGAAAESSRAAELARAAGHHAGEAAALNTTGWYLIEQGAYERAIATCSRALRVFQEVDDRQGAASAWHSIGYAHHHLAQYEQALAHYRESVTLCESLGDRYHQALTLEHIGDTHLAAGDTAAAHHSWHQAATLLEAADHPEAPRLRRRLQPRPGDPAGGREAGYGGGD
jgi:DNA-binding SARP family transcriptional activator/tetratricopeptide (TPR) repeat protein